MVYRTNELWNVELHKEERNSLWHASRRGSSVDMYNSAAVSKNRFNSSIIIALVSDIDFFEMILVMY